MRIRAGVLVLVGAVLILALASPALATDIFPDVGATHPFYSDIQALGSRGYISGFTDGTFKPDLLVSRQQMAKILVLANEAHSADVDNSDDPSFPDVLPSAGVPYPFDYVEECAAQSWFVGDALGYFRPFNNISRVQLALILVRAGGDSLEEPPAGYESGFADLGGVGAEAQAAIARAKFNGLLDGKTETTFDPWGYATRGHVSKMTNGLVEMIAEGMVTGATATPGAELNAVAAHLNAVLALGYNTTNPDVAAKVLFDTNAANDPYILDTREAADFAKGHIPGAVNVPLKELPRALLAGDERIPMDKEILIASYWGNDGNMANLLINSVRITDPVAQKAALDAKTAPPFPKSTVIFQGMTSWTFRRDVIPADTRFEDAQKAGIVVEKSTNATPVAGEDQAAFPTFRAFAEDDLAHMILVRAREFFDSFPTQFDMQLYPSALAAELEDGDSSDDPQIVSVRGTPDYQKAHIPGAINIPYQKAADLANFVKFVDPAKPAVVYCYTGHTGSIATMALGILGYDVKNLLYGFNGWTLTAPTSGQLKNFDIMKTWDFPVNDGDDGDLDSLSAYQAPSGCESCHSSLTAIFYDREVKNPPQGAPAAPSEGEG